jgi:hypothetical protein
MRYGEANISNPPEIMNAKAARARLIGWEFYSRQTWIVSSVVIRRLHSSTRLKDALALRANHVLRVDSPKLLRRYLVVAMRADCLEKFEHALQVRLPLRRHPRSLAASPYIRHTIRRLKSRALGVCSRLMPPVICHGCEQKLNRAISAMRRHLSAMTRAVHAVRNGPTDEQKRTLKEMLVISLHDAESEWDSYRSHLREHDLLPESG